MNSVGHIFLNKGNFKRGEVLFNGIATKSIEYNNEDYIELKKVAEYIGYNAKVSKVSSKIKKGDAVRIYEARIKTTFIKMSAISALVSEIRKSYKMQYVIQNGEAVGKRKLTSQETLDARRLACEEAKRDEQLEREIGIPKPMSRYKAMADYIERARIRRFGAKVKGIKFRYVEKPRFNIKLTLCVKDYVPSRFEGNINLAF